MFIRLPLLFRAVLVGWLLGTAYAGFGPSARSWPRTPPPQSAFIQHLDRLIPALRVHSNVPGAAVALIEQDEVVFMRGYGHADRDRQVPVTPHTVFNAGSISKTVTAWAVMHLVEEGKIDLDAPAEHYLTRWHLPDTTAAAEPITVRQLLSHTAGLSLPAVPEYRPGQPLPSLDEVLAAPDSGVTLVHKPGTTWSYSGGGYMVLQLLIEEVTGQPFATYVRETVLEPLGMHHSGFGWTPVLRAQAAVPYDDGRPAPYFRYAGQAAASFNTTAHDLARFVVAGLPGPDVEPPGQGVLHPATVALMQRPAPHTEQRSGIRYGLGYALWRLANGTWLAGHNGQNTGWAASHWMAPETGDGLVVLTNASDGFGFWRWVLCDWATWQSDTTWQGLCTGRPDALPPPPAPRRTAHAVVPTIPRSAFVDSLLGARFDGTTPGAAVLVARGGEVLHNAGYGLAELEASRPIQPDTPFYLASLSKPFTALAVMMLAEAGAHRYEDRLTAYFPELPSYADSVTVRHLLTHTSGIPDYYRFLDWSRFEGLSNQDVLDTLRAKPELDFPPGRQHRYSNSGYVLLSMLVERVSGQPLGAFLDERVFEPLEMTGTLVYDDTSLALPNRAFGYTRTDDGVRPMDYAAIRHADGSTSPLGFTTTGGGGVYSTVEDLYRWSQALFEYRLLPLDVLQPALTPQVQIDDGDEALGAESYGYGWYVTDHQGTRVVWHDGGMVGFSTILLHVPAQRLTVILLSNLAQTPVRELAWQIAEHYLAGS